LTSTVVPRSYLSYFLFVAQLAWLLTFLTTQFNTLTLLFSLLLSLT
jgi:hypothetical protein